MMSKTIEEMQAEVYKNNVDHGWFDEDRDVGTDIALLHTEVSEMFEAFRATGLSDATDVVRGLGHQRTLPKPEGFGSEAADVFIRLLDTCERRGVDLRAEYERKMEYNRTRPYKHGKLL
jgi:NTP pyrophosphatase (non-canonical NTP hydrolase)